jgi:carbon storage regulator
VPGGNRKCKDKEFEAMLVLSRKTGERIHIGENITIEIRRVAGNRVTLALEAPRAVRILRGELEQAAREFREPSATDNGDQTGPEPYAVIHRRLTVVPELPPQPASRDFAI